MSKKKNKKRRSLSPISSLLIISLAVLILIINILAFSYSWFTPTSEEAQGLSFADEFTVRSENCTFTTFQGTVVTESNQSQHSGYYLDQVDYSGTAIANDVEITVPARQQKRDSNNQLVYDENHNPVYENGRVYFRTEIQNLDTEHPSVVSLYHSKMPANLSIAVTYPSNTFYTTDAEYDDCFILRNAYVKVRDDNDVDGPGLLPVEWFLENSTDSDIPIRVTPYTESGVQKVSLYLMYN